MKMVKKRSALSSDFSHSASVLRVVLGDDEAEEARVAELLDERRGQLARAVPRGEVLLARPEHRLQRSDDRMQGLLLRDLRFRIRKEDLLLDLAEAERAHEARRLLVDHGVPPAG